MRISGPAELGSYFEIQKKKGGGGGKEKKKKASSYQLLFDLKLRVFALLTWVGKLLLL